MAKSMGVCPSCGKQELKIIDTRETKYNNIVTIRRRKTCLNCTCVFTTYEIPDVVLNFDSLVLKINTCIERFRKLSIFLND